MSTAPSWEVYPINSSGKRTGKSVIVRAANNERAQFAGRYWLGVVGRKARHVRAVPYHPELDIEIRMYVRKNA